LKLIAVLKVAK